MLIALFGNITKLPTFIGNTVTIVDGNITSGTQKTITIPDDGWYFVRATNMAINGDCHAGVWADNSRQILISASNSGTGVYIRATTSLMPLKKGTSITILATYTDAAAFCKLS